LKKSGFASRPHSSLGDAYSDATSARSLTKAGRKRRVMSHFGSKKKKLPEGPRPIPIPKTEAELKTIEADEIFFQKTKPFRTQIHVKDLIQVRRATVLASKMGVSDFDPLYKIESTADMIVKHVNVDNLVPIPLDSIKITVHKDVHRIPRKNK
jgi:hypothetical protein